MNDRLHALLKRRSVTAKELGEPGPSDAQLSKILTVAARVPDHKKLEPFRFIVFKNEARERFGEILANAYVKTNPANCLTENQDGAEREALLHYERNRFTRVPLVVAVVSSLVENQKAPAWEQTLTAGAVAMNMLHAVDALDFSGQWLTEWYAYNEDVNQALKLKPNERIAGFVYIGTKCKLPTERPRPNLEEKIMYW